MHHSRRSSERRQSSATTADRQQQRFGDGYNNYNECDDSARSGGCDFSSRSDGSVSSAFLSVASSFARLDFGNDNYGAAVDHSHRSGASALGSNAGGIRGGSARSSRRRFSRFDSLEGSLTERLGDDEPPSWTARERAQQVDRDPRLRGLLEAEIYESGVVTAAGYRAVHQRFLYSDAVDSEMRRQRELSATEKQGRMMRRRSSRFEILMLDAAEGFAEGFGQIVESANSIRRDSCVTTLSDEEDCLKSVNIAPHRRSSQVFSHLTQEQRVQLLLPGFKKEDDDHSVLSLDLQDIFHGAEGAKSHSLLSGEVDNDKAPLGCSDVSIADTAAFTTASESDTQSVYFEDVGDMTKKVREEEEELERSRQEIKLTLSVQSSEHSYADECGWLPWPDQSPNSNDDHGNLKDGNDLGDDDVGSYDLYDGQDLLEPFPSRDPR